MKRTRRRDGFTLVEVLVAMALFALIAIAGFTLLDGVLRTQGATQTRLARLAEVQRAMLVVSTDLDGITGSLSGSGKALELQKTNRTGALVTVRYDLTDARLTRTVAGAEGGRTQVLLENVSSVGWRFHRRRGDWLDAWPQPPALGASAPVGPAVSADTETGPSQGTTAVALDIVLNGIDGRPGATLRRVVSIPLMDDPVPAPAA